MKDTKGKEYFEAGRDTVMARGLALNKTHGLKIG